MSEENGKIRTYQPRWRPSGLRKSERFRTPIDVYFEKYPGCSKEELRQKDPRLLEAISLNGQEYLIDGEAPPEYQALVAAYDAVFTGPNGVRKKTVRPRRHGDKLLQWLLKTYPNGMPFAKNARKGETEERAFYNDLETNRLLHFYKKVEPLSGKDPVEFYYELCRSEGRIITRGQLQDRALTQKGGNAVYKMLARTSDPENPSQSLLERHVPKTTDKLSAAAKKRFNLSD